MSRSPIIPILLGLAATVAHGQQTARIVKYHTNDIVNIHAKMRYTTLIQLPPTEKILDAATGDKDFWIIDKVGNYCFIHPAKEGIFVSPDGAPRFTFFEDGSVTLTRFERYLDQYRPLFSALRAFELVYVSDAEKSFPFARAAFAAHFTETQVAGVSEQTPLGVEHFLGYLRAREMHESRSWPVTGRDLKVLEEGESLYTSLEHQALYAAWKMQSTNAEKIRQRFSQQGPQTKFTTLALPYIYPLFSLKRERKSSEEHGSWLRSGEWS